MRTCHRASIVAAAGAATLLVASSSRAQQNVVVTPGATAPAAGREVRPYEETRPNTGLITSGLVTLGLSYGAAAVVAGSNTRTDDDKLWYPVAGPWLDLANRNDCATVERAGGSCGAESTYKVMLVADGILQGIGALEILGGFVFPETRASMGGSPRHVASAPPAPTFRVAPARLPGGYGLAAVGSF